MPIEEKSELKTMITSSESVVERLNRANRLAEQGGGPQRIEDQHKKGKKTARERIRMLFDADSFVEIDRLVTSRSEEKNPSSKMYCESRSQI